MSDKFRKLGLMGFDGLAPGASKFVAVNEDSAFFAQNQRVDAWDLTRVRNLMGRSDLPKDLEKEARDLDADWSN